MPRINIDMSESLQDVMLTMGEGNPGALTVLRECLRKQGSVDFILGTLMHLDDMNIRGSQMWIAFKDYCAHCSDRIAHTDANLDRFIEAVKKRDPNMVDMINKASLKGSTGTQCKAVISGACYMSLQGRPMLSDADKYLLEKEIPLPDIPELS